MKERKEKRTLRRMKSTGRKSSCQPRASGISQARVARIIAVNPGSRYLGLAVFDRIRLLDWRVRCVTGKNASTKAATLLRILEQLFVRHHPQVVVIKRLHPRHLSATLNRLNSEIDRFCVRHELQMLRLSNQETRALLLPAGARSKWSLAQEAVKEYPMLQREFSSEKAAKDAYHIRMFEAVALGMAAQRRLRV